MTKNSYNSRPAAGKPLVPVLFIIGFLLVAVIGNFVADHFKSEVPHSAFDQQVAAAGLMRTAQRAIRSERIKRGIATDPHTDINGTGLIGQAWSPITTTTGNLEAKRTSTNPGFAALMVRLLLEAGLKPGDVVAVGASGSFPALALATLSAANVLGLEPLMIYSIGSSSYGANDPDFTLIEMLDVWNQERLLPYAPIAVSFGGQDDRGIGLLSGGTPPEFLRIANASGLPLIYEPSVSDSIRKRIQHYNRHAGHRPVDCFVNIGGASANYGTTPAALQLANGLIHPDPRYLMNTDNGLIFYFLHQQIPVIHLLDIKHLALSYGLAVDPAPLPAIGKGGVYSQIFRPKGWIAFFIMGCAAILVFGRCAGSMKKMKIDNFRQ